MNEAAGYMLGAAVWLLIGMACAVLNARQAARFNRALALKYPSTTPRRSVWSRIGFVLMYVFAGPCGLQSILLSNRRDLVGDRHWEAAR